MISPTTSFSYFWILTTIYFVMKYFLLDKYKVKKNPPNKSLSIGLLVAYLAIMVSLQLSANISNAKEKCGGNPQTAPAIMYTLIPNIFIFGVLLVGLLLFPGWKAPFSNTIGYLIVCLPFMKIKDIFNNMLIPSSTSTGTNKLLKLVYEDPSIMINQIVPEKIDLFFQKMRTPPNSILTSNSTIFNENFPKLHDLVVIKDSIAEYIWYLLTGALVISNSYSYIMSITCKRKASELQGKLDAIFENPKKEPKKQKWIMGY